jgi:hypothetical protein
MFGELRSASSLFRATLSVSLESAACPHNGRVVFRDRRVILLKLLLTTPSQTRRVSGHRPKIS